MKKSIKAYILMFGVASVLQANASGFNFGLGLSYGLDYIKHTDQTNTDRKFGIVLSPQWVGDRGWLIEVPLIISYIAPDAQYFQAYYNNTGDGANGDISLLAGWYLIDSNIFKLSIKGGVGYNFSYMFAYRYRMTSSTELVKDFSFVNYKSLSLKIGAEIGLKKHAFGATFNYYLPMDETRDLMSSHFNNGGVAAPIQTQTAQKVQGSTGFTCYYAYRF